MTSPPATKVKKNPLTPCTPMQPQWVLRCEAAQARSPYPVSFAMRPGQRRQDRLVVESRGSDALWAVFDGHFSHEVAGHAAARVSEFVFGNPWWPSAPGDVLRGALRSCHESARQESLHGGSTAVVVVASNGWLWCASAGDSRAVAGLRSGRALRLSGDHTASNPEEIARIQSCGGRLDFGRLGGLPMTRGLGNFSLETEGFSCLADVTSLPRCEAEFVVVASDGLWDVMDDERCCAVVREFGLRAGVAEHLCDLARGAGSADDIAVVVAYFFPEEEAAGAAGA
eukprot:TRINITY_DN45336_c0_g1_i1.p1 TRINITY_DN45336_c0_g1~~TRINITY_DN45336_c0_g1_i1.p1  ORF type:complete len:322 (-),score=40.09 TRINITY_DN45336_c0_g1_i1:57-908(-)